MIVKIYYDDHIATYTNIINLHTCIVYKLLFIQSSHIRQNMYCLLSIVLAVCCTWICAVLPCSDCTVASTYINSTHMASIYVDKAATVCS